MARFYTGIGSRETPPDIMELMTKFAAISEQKGFVLRSGHAAGADIAFERGVQDKNNMEIYIPWEGFADGRTINGYIIPPDAHDYVMKYHPAGNKLKSGALKLMNRNTYQVLGQDLNTPSNFVVCWTKCGDEINPVGGTGQAVRIAVDSGVPVFNLANPSTYQRIKKFCDEHRGPNG
jgi:hypothetical protein